MGKNTVKENIPTERAMRVVMVGDKPTSHTTPSTGKMA
jgi:hypothetical protein